MRASAGGSRANSPPGGAGAESEGEVTKTGPHPTGRQWTDADDAQLLALLESKMDRIVIAKEIEPDHAGHRPAKECLEETPPSRNRAEGEGKMTMRLHERIHAMNQRRRRLPLRDRLRSRRRLVELGLRAKAAN
jgi:hypothetical protein